MTDQEQVVPSKMNPVQEGSNQFAALFDAMPARRIGKLEDIVGVVVYLCSQAGVGDARPLTPLSSKLI